MADAEAATSKIKIELPSLIISPLRIVAVIAPDVGRHIADQHIADAERDSCRLSVVAPAVQHMRNAGIRK
jgi:hypothetical protein